VGQGSVADLWRIFREARFTVANDSGLAHVASLLGSRTHVIWGAGDLRKTRPLGPGETRWTLNPVECWPCERNRCPLGGGEHLKCLAGIRPEKVAEEMAWLWRA
jgi:heptosyltransferase-2